MSKLSQLHAELLEQAVEMGYSSLEYAIDVAGCGIDYEKGKLLSPEEAAHNALLREKEELIEKLTACRDDAADLAMGTGTHTDKWAQTALDVDEAINFIEENVK